MKIYIEHSNAAPSMFILNLNKNIRLHKMVFHKIYAINTIHDTIKIKTQADEPLGTLSRTCVLMSEGT